VADANPAVTSYQSQLAHSFNSIGILLSDTGKPADALASYEKARDILQKVADANPAVTSYQSQLAHSFNSIGILLSATGKPTEALASYEKARDIYQKLADANPAVTSYQRDLAKSNFNVGRLHAKEGRFVEAFALLDAGLAFCEKLVAANSKTVEYTTILGMSHAFRGWARVRVGQPERAANDLRKAVELWAKDPALTLEVRFEKFRALALLAKLGADAKSGVTVAEAKAFADQSVAALTDAIKGGSSQLKELKEPDFDAIRDRADFKKLIAELEKPNKEK
jgi:tetratricopeptide (TPR) repeat protein